MVDIKDLKNRLLYETYDFETPISNGYFKYSAAENTYGILVPSINADVAAKSKKYKFTEDGFVSLCKFIGGQKNFLMSLRPEIREKVINEKLDQKIDKKVVIRCVVDDEKDYNIRTIISKNWSQFDNIDVVATLEPMLSEYGLQLEGVNISSYKMDLRVTFDSEMGSDDDRMTIGISILNDECSVRPLLVDLTLFRGLTSSGIILRRRMKSIASVPHSTITSEKFASRMAMILTALQPNLQHIAGVLSSMKNHNISTDMYDVIKNKWQKYYRIPKKMLSTAMDSSPTSYYDLINGIAEAARDSENMNARRRGEIAAGNIISDMLSANDATKLGSVFIKKSQQ